MKIKFLLEYIFFSFFTYSIKMMPAGLSVKFGRLLGAFFHLIDWKHRRIAEANISSALHLGVDETKALVAQVFKNLGQVFAEFIKPRSFASSYVDEFVDVEGLENAEEAKNMGKGVLVLAAHLGNWELLGSALLKHLGPVTVVYRRAKNPYVSDFIKNTRLKRGINTISHRNSARNILGILKKSESVGILLDQHAIHEDAIVADFMGRPAATHYGLALLAIRTGTPVLPAFLVREKDGRYKCIYDKPLLFEKGDDMDKDILRATNLFNKVIEGYIKRYPGQWFWVHKRWKIDKHNKD